MIIFVVFGVSCLVLYNLSISTQNTLTIQSHDGSGYTNPVTGTYSYKQGTNIQVLAIPSYGWQFSHWYLDGVDSGSTNPVNVTMNSAHKLQAVFTLVQGEYTVTVSVSGEGTVDQSPSQATYSPGSSVQLTATPQGGWVFAGWSGVLMGLENPVTIVMDSNKSLTATFTRIQAQYALMILSSSGPGITSPTEGSHVYTEGAKVFVFAVPALGYKLSYWLLDGANVGVAIPITVTMNTSHTIKAVFITQSNATHTIYKSGSIYYARTEATGAVVSNSDFVTLFEDVFVNNAVIQIQPATYYVTHPGGIEVSYKNNVTVYGAPGVFFKQALLAPAQPVLLLSQVKCTNIYWYDVVFDQDYQNPNHLPMTSYGMYAVIKPGAAGNNIWFTRCQIINGIDVGVLTGECNGLHFIDCVFNHFGEHVFYLTSITNLEIKNCEIYNWAKYGRGFALKLTACVNVNVADCWWEPNQDGVGYRASGFPSDPSSGVYGPVIMDYCEDLYFTGCTWRNVNSNSGRNVGLLITLDYPVYNINFTNCHWYGFGSGPTIDSDPSFNNAAQLHLTNCTFD